MSFSEGDNLKLLERFHKAIIDQDLEILSDLIHEEYQVWDDDMLSIQSSRSVFPNFELLKGKEGMLHRFRSIDIGEFLQPIEM